MLDQCAKYKCIPVQPTGNSETTKRPLKPTCPLPNCPDGYDVQNVTTGGVGVCGTFTCQLNNKADSICDVTGRSFTTFDGTDFKVDVCNHILARDLVANKWSITSEWELTEV